MTILLIGIGAVHCLVLLVLATELVIERRLNAALADRNAVQAQALARYHRLDDVRSRFEAECG